MTPSPGHDARDVLSARGGGLGGELRAELREFASRAVAGVCWALLGFGLLFLYSATAPDSGQFWDTMRRTTVAWIGVALLLAGLPVGVAALRLDRPHRRLYAPGETRTGVRHPVLLVVALAVTAVLAAVLAVVLATAG